MPGEPRPDKSNVEGDIAEVTKKLSEISSRWGIEDPAERNEPELRRLEAEVGNQVEQLLSTDISAEDNSELLDSVNAAISMFDDSSVVQVLRKIKAKLEGREITQEELDIDIIG